MSFGFSIGDFIATGELAYKLYRDVFMVARKAPSEVRDLTVELSSLSQCIQLLVDQVQDQDSLLVRAGPSRVTMVNEMMQGARATLEALQVFAHKHSSILSVHEGRNKVMRSWDQLKYAKDAGSINGLRSKLVYHYSVMQLLLTSVGNSSLERLEQNNKAMANNVETIKDLLTQALPLPPVYDQIDKDSLNSPATHQQPVPPRVSAVQIENTKLLLSEKFMEAAEINGSWLSFGIETWIQAGKWWLMKAQSTIPVDDGDKPIQVDVQGYMNLLKASWILIDVINEHPQRTFSLQSHRQQTAVRILADSIAHLLRRVRSKAFILPSLKAITASNCSIWAGSPTFTLQLRRQATSTSFEWATSDAELLFQRIGICNAAGGASAECVVLLLLDRQANCIRLMAQTATGAELFNFDAVQHLRSYNLRLESGDGGRLHLFTDARMGFRRHFQPLYEEPETGPQGFRDCTIKLASSSDIYELVNLLEGASLFLSCFTDADAIAMLSFIILDAISFDAYWNTSTCERTASTSALRRRVLGPATEDSNELAQLASKACDTIKQTPAPQLLTSHSNTLLGISEGLQQAGAHQERLHHILSLAYQTGANNIISALTTAGLDKKHLQNLLRTTVLQNIIKAAQWSLLHDLLSLEETPQDEAEIEEAFSSICATVKRRFRLLSDYAGETSPHQIEPLIKLLAIIPLDAYKEAFSPGSSMFSFESIIPAISHYVSPQAKSRALTQAASHGLPLRADPTSVIDITVQLQDILIALQGGGLSGETEHKALRDFQKDLADTVEVPDDTLEFIKDILEGHKGINRLPPYRWLFTYIMSGQPAVRHFDTWPRRIEIHHRISTFCGGSY